MSRATEEALFNALAAHLLAEEAIDRDELITAWVIAYAGELPAQADAARYGHSSPEGQRYHVSHGLAAGLLAAFNAGVGSVRGDDE